ncbi:MAG: type VI secretion system tube protein Hcp [Azoarcus sp.]|jgi:type VI secretion system secreted protein Hcp|nr:type VI secretion system tube protein Hcp [Azoarcus sp.]
MQDIYVKIEGIAGESQDASHKGWIDALGFSYLITQTSSEAFGGGLGVGRANFNALSFTHYVDRATSALFQYCAAGKHIPKVELSACKSGDGAKE